jgi:hypothetical protein
MRNLEICEIEEVSGGGTGFGALNEFVWNPTFWDVEDPFNISVLIG